MKNFLIRMSALLVMAIFYLPIMQANTPVYTFFGVNLYIWVWFFVLVVFGTVRFFSKSYLYLYLYIAAYVLFMGVFWRETGDLRESILNLFAIFLPVSLYEYFIYSRDLKGLDYVVKGALVFIAISCLINIGIFVFTGVSSRMIYSGTVQTGTDFGRTINRLGSAGIMFYYGLSLIIPAVVACFKSIPKWNRTRVGLLLFLVIAMVALFLAEYATAMLLGLVGLVFAMLGVRRFRTSLIITLIFALVSFFLPRGFLAYGFGYAADISQGETMSARLSDLSITMEEGVGVADTHTARRADRIPYLLRHIIRSPFIGGGPSTGHSFWLDRLSMYGILGLLPLFFIYRYQFIRNNSMFNETYKFYYLLTLMIFISMGVMKNMAGAHFTLSFLLLVPGLFHTSLYDKTQYVIFDAYGAKRTHTG